MLGAIFSFLGGSAFRMVWGEVSAFFSRKQDQQYEIERMRVQAELEAAQHARNLEAIRVQAELGVQTIRVQGEADLAQIEADAWRQAVGDSQKPTGIRIVDAWNASIRPAYATIALALWVLSLHRTGWAPSVWDLELMAAIAGFFFADRTLGKRGK